MDMHLQDKVVLITGGGNGLGQAMVYAFLREGAKVAFCDISEENSALTLNEAADMGFSDVLATRTDVSDSAAVREMFARVTERFGTLDVLVNNAAVFRTSPQALKDRYNCLQLKSTPTPKHSLEITRNMSDEEWLHSIAVNLNGVFYCTREALNIMEPKHYGKIINIASTGGISGLSFHSPNYSAAKAGVCGFTRSVAAEVAGAGINVNAIAPGGIATRTFNDLLKKWGPELTARQMQIIPLGRFGSLEEYASLAVYLASDHAGYLVGQVISPNGGVVM